MCSRVGTILLEKVLSRIGHKEVRGCRLSTVTYEIVFLVVCLKEH